MGKWTPDYTDDVLRSKISSLVSGAIRRASVEKNPSTLTYETFVNELDIGDSFTTSIIDILVKELADRRKRENNANDRRLIGERTLRDIRLLASSHRVYPSRLMSRTATRRSFNMTDYLTAHPSEMDIDDEEYDLDQVAVDLTGNIEGARVNPELFDAFSSSGWYPPTARRITASPSPVDELPPLPPMRSPPSQSAVWPGVTTGSGSTSSLTRQASLRRSAAARSRLSYLADPSTRRRALRELPMRSETAENVTEPRDVPAWHRPTTTARRFFSFGRTRRHEAPSWSDLSYPSDDDITYNAIPPSAVYTTSALHSQPSPDIEDRAEDELLVRAPRLRRGGLRAPESILSRHASPVTAIVPSTETPAPIVAPEPRPAENTTQANEEPVAYPTPGSSENENLP